jgi:uncharacterized circularly permuted ATP-grasp superfamily protein
VIEFFAKYDTGEFYDEMFGAPGKARPHYERLLQRFTELKKDEFDRKRELAALTLLRQGVTFTVYSDAQGTERIFPFDLIPRIISAAEWEKIERGLEQRIIALNLFLHDIYHGQSILRDGVIPKDYVWQAAHFRPEFMHFNVPQNIYIHICGTDLVRDRDGNFLVLEDNARCPSGVSYVIQNRQVMRRVFPNLFAQHRVRPVEDYSQELLNVLRYIAPAGTTNPTVVLLTPGIYNSAYFEHSFLARSMGIEIVEGRDLIAHDGKIFMRTTKGLQPVDVIYRRINDDFLDPEAFVPESMLGVPGLMRAYRAGNLALANAVGTGVADDKAVYAYVPRIIRYYLDEDPILPNVETHICREPKALRYTLDRLAELVVKPVGEAGGYGITVGPRASLQELDECRAKLVADPANYISQPCINLSVAPTLVDGQIEPRHVDLRPFAVTGSSTWVLPGGLTRVALKRGSLVVNSSQGGGSKDTWVVE